MSPKTLSYILSGVITVESLIMIQSLIWNQKKSEVIRTLQDLTNYYIYLLDENDVDLNDYDRLALNTIISSSGLDLFEETDE